MLRFGLNSKSIARIKNRLKIVKKLLDYLVKVEYIIFVILFI